MITRFLLILLLVLAAFGGVTVWLIKYPSPWSATATTIVCGGGVVLLIAVVFHLLWRPMLAPFPPQEPAPDAVRRYFQSFGIGIVNMSLSVHVAVDEDYLHLIPLAIWRALGARPASIPWSAMEPIGKSGRVVRVAGHRLDGPKWCLELASPQREDEPDGG
ncbi:MAG: hypothetical protein ACYSTY_09025 [Planctomycetota bacterium]|jgi:hypothetical protein